MPVPDLLCDKPAVRLDAATLKQTLTFAFASGVPGGVFAQALEASRLPPSSWDPRSFAKEIFLPELISGCCKVTIGGHRYDIDRAHLGRIISQPPSNVAVAEFRRDVLREIAGSESLRGEFERVYVGLYQFRTLLETPPLARRLDANRRRLDSLSIPKNG